MEVVAAYCKKCDSEVGRFRNSWIGIGNTYFSPAYSPLSTDGIKPTGDIFEAGQDSQIEDSVLQDIACEKCSALLGLRCDKAPDDHLLKKDQLILRLAEMSLLSEATGKKVKISVLKSFSLTAAPAIQRNASTNILSPIPQARLKTAGLSIQPPQAIKSNAQIPVATAQSTPLVSDISKFKSWAENVIHVQQKDIDRLSGTLERVEREMRLFKEFMVEVRADMASRVPVPAQAIEQQDVASLRAELDELRQQINKNGGLVSRSSLDIATKDIDAVAEDVQRVSRKANEVDTLKVEIEAMRAEIKSVDSTAIKKAELESIRANVQLLASAALNNQGSESGLRNRNSSIRDKRKHSIYDQEQTTPEVQVLNRTSSKRRKVSNNTSPPDNSNMASGTWQRGFHKANGQTGVTNSSSEHTLSSPTLDGQDGDMHSAGEEDVPTNICAPDPLTPLDSSSNAPSSFRVASKAVVEINTSMPPPTMMPLRNGTIFSAGSRNELLEVSHIEAATGRKSQYYGKRLTASSYVKQGNLQRRKANATVLNEVFANGLIDNAQPSENEKGTRRSLRPRKGQSNPNPIPSIEHEESEDSSDDRPGQPDADADENDEQDEDVDEYEDQVGRGEKKYETPNGEDPNRRLIFGPGYRMKSGEDPTQTHASFSAMSRAQRENTTPIIEVDKPFDKVHLPKFYKCGNCTKDYRTLQALDYHHHNSPVCRQSASDIVPEGFKCACCKRVYQTFTGIKDHIILCRSREETGFPFLNCKKCGKMYKQNAALAKHHCKPADLRKHEAGQDGVNEGSEEAEEEMADENKTPAPVRRTRVAERERLVRQTLEREMGSE